MPIKITDDDMDHVPGKEIKIVKEIDQQELENRLEELLITLKDLTGLVQSADPSQYRQILPSIEFLKKIKAQADELLNYWLLLKSFESSKKRRKPIDKGPQGKGIDPENREISHHPVPPSEPLAEN